MRRSTLVALAVLSGCFSDVDSETREAEDAASGTSETADVTTGPEASTSAPETSASNTATTVVDTGGSGGPGCADGLTCLTLPEGWTAALRVDVGGAANCPMGFVPDDGGRLDAPAIDCECTCDMPTNPCELRGRLNSSSCQGPLDAADPMGCVATTGADLDPSFQAEVLPPPCAWAGIPTATPPPNAQQLCLPSEALAGCGAGMWCGPTAGTRCIQRAGDEQCPLDYGQRHIMASSWAASMQCESGEVCPGTCSFECDQAITLYTSTDCESVGEAAVAGGDCDASAQTRFSMSQDDPAPTCVADAESRPVPAMADENQTTVCCRD